MKAFVLTVIFTLLIFVVLTIFGYNNPLFVFINRTPPPAPTPPRLTPLRVGSADYLVEIADTPEEQKMGLGGRKNLPKNQGLLFIFGQKDFYLFWMQNMKFPLDLIWIDDETVVEITKNVPVPAGSQKITTYQPTVPVNKVLEINAGEADRQKIGVEDKVVLGE